MTAARMSGSTRTIWIMALTAVISLAAGLGLSRLIVSPGDAAAQAAPPKAGPITVPVERRALANDVVLRGDAIYADPASVVVETGDIGGPAVVTGQVPVVGATLDAGAIMLEVAGRPVILLPGELPVYRTLRVGVSGPDVLQLKAALGGLGIDAGDASSADYDGKAAAAVVELYARVGYPAPSAGEEAELALDGAQDTVRAADEQVDAAQRALTAATAGPGPVDRMAKDNAIRKAQRELTEAEILAGQPVDPEIKDGPPPIRPSEIENLTDRVTAAVVDRDALLAPVDAAEQRAALAAAKRQRTDARDDLTKAERGVQTPLPAAEVVYLTSTPRRVDSVAVRRGSAVAGTAVMSVSGAALLIAGTLPDADASLITVGAPVRIALPSGGEAPGTVQSVGLPAEPGTATGGATGGDGSPAPARAPAVDANRKRVVVVPDALTDEQRAELQGANVRMTIPVSSTEGEVLAVPTAALTAGAGGESRVEILTADGESTLVTVTTGLAADGFVEVTADGGGLTEGARVVVGVAAAEAGEPGESEPSGTPSEEPST